MDNKIIVWSQELSTGIIWQDIQHREFLDISNQFTTTFF